ncbi:MAG: 6-phosphogluconolactonase [Cryobacterium sp.]|nr:6-phosphogluconolactonase [Cryobacterium sp.]
MTTGPNLVTFETRAELVKSVGEKVLELLASLKSKQNQINIALTGGTVGGEILAAINEMKFAENLWNSVHFWWSDERWLPSGDSERNDFQADQFLLRKLEIDGLITESQIHRFPSQDSGMDLDAAAAEYEVELREHSKDRSAIVEFDLALLGVGPDGHIASLFPGSRGIEATEISTIAVRNSPKPPPERLSLSLPAINQSKRIWLCLAGRDKAAALCLALTGANTTQVPAAGVRATEETCFFADRDAAELVPNEIREQL